MRRIALLFASAVINASTSPAVASECMSTRDLDALRARWATQLSQPASIVDQEKTCRAYATSFYESVILRQVAVRCADGERNLALLDSDVNAFNDQISTKCGAATNETP
jgi:hypothetical protein